jgi:hypothetical protein
MKKFYVTVERTTVESAGVVVVAADEEAAKDLATAMAHDAARYEWDWISSDFGPADTEVEEVDDDEPAPSAAEGRSKHA